MSKQDEFKFKISIEAALGGSFCKNFVKSVDALYGDGERVSASVESADDKIFITIKAKDINISRSIVNNYLQSIKTAMDVNEL